MNKSNRFDSFIGHNFFQLIYLNFHATTPWTISSAFFWNLNDICFAQNTDPVSVCFWYWLFVEFGVWSFPSFSQFWSPGLRCPNTLGTAFSTIIGIFCTPIRCFPTWLLWPLSISLDLSDQVLQISRCPFGTALQINWADEYPFYWSDSQ